MNTYSVRYTRSRLWLCPLWTAAVNAYRDYTLARHLYREGILRERTVHHWHRECVRAATVWTREAGVVGLALLTPAATAHGS